MHLRHVLLINLLWHHLVLGCRHSHNRLGGKVLIWISINNCSRRWNKFLLYIDDGSIRLYVCDILGAIRVECIHVNSSFRFKWPSSAVWVAHAAKNNCNNNKHDYNSNSRDNSSWLTALLGNMLLANIILCQASWINLIAVVGVPVVVGVHSVSKIHLIGVNVSVNRARSINGNRSSYVARSVYSSRRSIRRTRWRSVGWSISRWFVRWCSVSAWTVGTRTVGARAVRARTIRRWAWPWRSWWSRARSC